MNLFSENTSVATSISSSDANTWTYASLSASTQERIRRLISFTVFDELDLQTNTVIRLSFFRFINLPHPKLGNNF